MKQILLGNYFLISVAIIIAVGCSYWTYSKKYDVKYQADKAEELLLLTGDAIPHQLSDKVKLYDFDSEYILLIEHSSKIKPIQLIKKEISDGGYTLEGVSHDGVYRVSGSVNYLSSKGADINIDSIEHYKEGVVYSDIYKFIRS